MLAPRTDVRQTFRTMNPSLPADPYSLQGHATGAAVDADGALLRRMAA